MRNSKGFTLIELVMVIVILGILAAVALPTFFNLQDEARTAACQGALGGLRSGISIWYAKEATSGTPTWPTLADLTSAAAGGVMTNGSIPPNPYNDSTAIVTAAARGVVADAGWGYNPATGEIWGATADSSTY